MTRLLLLICLLFVSIFAQSYALADSLGFADSLAAQGDQYRAITEYKRFIYENPQSELVPKARLSIAKSLISGERWTNADKALEELFTLHPESRESKEGRRVYADAAYTRGDYGLARERYRLLVKQPLADAIIDYVNFRIGWTYLEQDRPEKARSNFSLLPNPQNAQLLADLDGYESLALKSPGIAGTLSAVLPGAGQVYTGRYKQAAVAFLLNGAFILGSIEAFNNENYAVGSILLFFEIGWYGGNIYNAANNAHKFNRRLKHEYKKQMRSKMNLQVGLHKSTPMLALKIHF